MAGSVAAVAPTFSVTPVVYAAGAGLSQSLARTDTRGLPSSGTPARAARPVSITGGCSSPVTVIVSADPPLGVAVMVHVTASCVCMALGSVVQGMLAIVRSAAAVAVPNETELLSTVAVQSPVAPPLKVTSSAPLDG